MFINDLVYGEFEITEPVILDIINSDDFKRLKYICMSGYYPAYKENNPCITNRYDHSIGVMLLLRKYNASIEEQIAGLIHDVSHSAFSHAIDYIKDNENDQKTQGGQDDIHGEFVRKSEIAGILKKYNLDIDYILNDLNFTLKENNTPDICADRIDYSLRDSFNTYGIINREQLNLILNSLVVHNGSFLLSNFESAKLFANFFIELDTKYYSGLRSAIMFAIGGKFFQIAIKNNYLEIDDFYKYGDKEIIEKLDKYFDLDFELKKYYDLLNLPTEYYEDNKNNFIRHIFCKSRFVDPKFIENGKILGRVSDFDKDFKDVIKNKQKFKEYYIALK